MRAFEDFTPGTSALYGPVTVTAADIVAFAEVFDPQPFHLDAEAAKGTLLGGLAASGWHTSAIMMRMICDAFLIDSTSMGSPGIEQAKWIKPLRPDDRLMLRWTVTDRRASRSRPDMGLVTFEFVLANEAGEQVMTMSNVIMFARRAAAAGAA